jgi:hypothetical protein
MLSAQKPAASQNGSVAQRPSLPHPLLAHISSSVQADPPGSFAVQVPIEPLLNTQVLATSQTVPGSLPHACPAGTTAAQVRSGLHCTDAQERRGSLLHGAPPPPSRWQVRIAGSDEERLYNPAFRSQTAPVKTVLLVLGSTPKPAMITPVDYHETVDAMCVASG